MPFLLLIIGFLAVVSAIKGTYSDLGTLIVNDLKGSAASPGYIYWVSSIIAIGVVGYYSPLQKFSRAFLILIILGMVLANQGFFTQLQNALKSVGTTPVEPAKQDTTQSASTSSGGTTSQQTSSTDSTQQTAGDVTSIANAGKAVLSLGEMLAAFAFV